MSSVGWRERGDQNAVGKACLRTVGCPATLVDLDPCTFLICETGHEDPFEPGLPRPSVLGADRLCGMICLHVGDMLGAGDPNSPVYKDVINRL